MKITVTKVDIDKGEPRTANNCPIARAVGKLTKKFKPAVGLDTISFYNSNSDRQFIMKMPSSARAFVQKFDNFEKVEPFEFSIPLERKLKSKQVQSS